MKILVFTILLAISQICSAQKVDTLWFNNKWERSVKDSATYYRVTQYNASNSFLIKDYFKSGEIQMEGTYSSLNPLIKNGNFTWWFRNGKKKMDATFRNDTTERFIEYDAEGKIKNQKQYLEVLTRENGTFIRRTVEIDAAPEFPGGREALGRYISSNINYPESAKKKGISGRVIVQFVVSVNGDVEDPVIVQGVNPALDKEALKVIKGMPNWIPGKINGMPVKVSQMLPLVF